MIIIKKKDKILKLVKEMTQDRSKGMTAKEVAKEADITRSTASRYLNKLVKEGKMKKTNSRPVYYSIIKTKIILKSKKLDNIIAVQPPKYGEYVC